jgi:hypothetical protein
MGTQDDPVSLDGTVVPFGVLDVLQILCLQGFRVVLSLQGSERERLADRVLFPTDPARSPSRGGCLGLCEC